MATFSTFSTILPDPSHRWGTAGEVSASTGSFGPGFKSVKLSSTDSLMRSKTNAQRLYRDVGSYHIWTIDIGYNPMACTEFNMLHAFLLFKQNTFTPFFVSLPQYAAQTTTDKTTNGNKVKGDSVILVDGSAPTASEPGHVFKIGTETKLYEVTRVETSSEFFTPDGAPGADQERIHFTPGLQKDVSSGTTISFSDPMFYVVQIGGLQYSLDKDNLYSIPLKLEEVVDAQ